MVSVRQESLLISDTERCYRAPSGYPEKGNLEKSSGKGLVYRTYVLYS